MTDQPRDQRGRFTSDTDWPLMEIAVIREVRPPGQDWRTAAWRNGHLPETEQYALELMRHGLTDKLEQFIAKVESGDEPLTVSGKGSYFGL